jgi:uncharacterized protein (DUF302 family)
MRYKGFTNWYFLSSKPASVRMKMVQTERALGTAVYLQTDFATALEKVTAALQVEGFGVLTEIDVRATMKKKLDVEFRPYKILGVCNPPLAYKALSAAPEIGLMLPCNVTVSQEEDGRILVNLINPELMLGMIDLPALAEAASEAKERLDHVAAALR